MEKCAKTIRRVAKLENALKCHSKINLAENQPMRPSTKN